MFCVHLDSNYQKISILTTFNLPKTCLRFYEHTFKLQVLGKGCFKNSIGVRRKLLLMLESVANKKRFVHSSKEQLLAMLNLQFYIRCTHFFLPKMPQNIQNGDRIKSWSLPECSKCFLFATDSIQSSPIDVI